MTKFEFKGKIIDDYKVDFNWDDYPDFCDAHIEWAEYEDGTRLTDDELDELESSDLGYEMKVNQAF